MIALTFDDGLRCHREIVVPILRTHGMQGTFFIPICREDPVGKYQFDDRTVGFWDFWRHATDMEVGAHSVTHSRPNFRNVHEVRQSQIMLMRHLRREVDVYAHPYCEATDAHRFEVSRFFKAGRGGPNAPLMCWWDMPSTVITADNILQWRPTRDEVLMFHGVGEEGSWGNVSARDFSMLLEQCKGQEILTYANLVKRLRTP